MAISSRPCPVCKCTEFLAESLDFTIVVLNRPLFAVLLERIWSLDHKKWKNHVLIVTSTDTRGRNQAARMDEASETKPEAALGRQTQVSGPN